MESPNPKVALHGNTHECARYNMLLFLLSEVSARGVFQIANNRLFYVGFKYLRKDFEFTFTLRQWEEF